MFSGELLPWYAGAEFRQVSALDPLLGPSQVDLNHFPGYHVTAVKIRKYFWKTC